MPKRKASELSNASSTQHEVDSPILVERANRLDSLRFIEAYIDNTRLRFPAAGTKNHASREVDVHTSASVRHPDLKTCFDLIEATSRNDYEASSMGWQPKRKKKEMEEEDMRYLLVRKDSHSAVEGFLSFMLTHDSTPSVPVLYIYEIHLDDRLRGSGLGTHLMESAEQIAQKVGVRKVMLTCFLSNTKALSFYNSRGYRMDICSPGDRETRNKIVKTDYVILSKDVRPLPRDSTESDKITDVCPTSLTSAPVQQEADNSEEVLTCQNDVAEVLTTTDAIQQAQEPFEDGNGMHFAAKHALSMGDLETAASDRDELATIVEPFTLRPTILASFHSTVDGQHSELPQKLRKLNRELKAAEPNGMWVVQVS